MVEVFEETGSEGATIVAESVIRLQFEPLFINFKPDVGDTRQWLGLYEKEYLNCINLII